MFGRSEDWEQRRKMPDTGKKDIYFRKTVLEPDFTQIRPLLAL